MARSFRSLSQLVRGTWEYHIEYRHRTAIKGQALVDFIAEMTRPIELNREKESERFWQVYIDGSSIEKKSGAGIVLITPDGITLSSPMRFAFKASNNIVEYEALLARLR